VEDVVEVVCDPARERPHRLHLLRLTELVLEPAPRRDVDHRRHHQHAALGADRIEADLHRDLGAVLADPMEIATGPHGARVRIALVAPTQLRMNTTDRRGDQEVHGPADQPARS
jgi:hypothetical protein